MESKMKYLRLFRPKYLIIFVICVILFVSYKILEPEIFMTKDRKERGDDIQVDSRPENSDESDTLHLKKGRKPELSKREAVISELIDKYHIDFVNPEKMADSPWAVAAQWIQSREIHPESAPELGAVLKAMASAPITSADVGHRGTQLKLTLYLEGGQRVAFKPKWYGRDHIITGEPYAGADRHNGEIVAFHLNRILELRRTPLVVGRRINLQTQVLPVAQKELSDTFFERDNSTCFYGKCYYCKGTEDGVCADGDILEGAVVLWFPHTWQLSLSKHPWSRLYRDGKKARWEYDDHFCATIPQSFHSGPRLLDIIDTAVFDYLIGNADRHHYETFKDVDDAVLLLLDNAKSFGNPYWDERSILAPLYQCCRLRMTTWRRLLLFQEGVLSEVLKGVLETEPLSPLITEPHFEALDRRLKHALDEVDKCITKHGINIVLENDR